jgi:hypothetical protein
MDEALTWMLTNGDQLSAEEEGMEDGEGESEDQLQRTHWIVSMP